MLLMIGESHRISYREETEKDPSTHSLNGLAQLSSLSYDGTLKRTHTAFHGMWEHLQLPGQYLMGPQNSDFVVARPC